MSRENPQKSVDTILSYPSLDMDKIQDLEEKNDDEQEQNEQEGGEKENKGGGKIINYPSLDETISKHPTHRKVSSFIAPNDLVVHTIVIGGGLSGLGLAIELKEKGKSVLVLEKNDPNSADANRFNTVYGASYKGAGILNIQSEGASVTNHWADLTMKGFQKLKIPIKKSGAFTISHETVNGADYLEEYVPPSEYILMEQKEPNLNYNEIKTMLHHEQVAVANPEEAMQAAFKYAKDIGIVFAFGGDLQSIQRPKELWEVHVKFPLNLVVEKRFKAENLVIAAGPHSKDIMKKFFNMHLPVTKVMGIIMQTEPMEEKEYFNAPIFGTMPTKKSLLKKLTGICTRKRGIEISHDLGDDKPLQTDVYLNMQGGRIYIGGPKIVLKDDYLMDDLKPNAEKNQKKLRAVVDFAHRLVNFPANTSFKKMWSGVMCFSDDGKSFVGPVKQEKNLYLCTGFASYGFQKGFGAGTWLADVILKKRDLSFEKEKDFGSVFPGERIKKV